MRIVNYQLTTILIRCGLCGLTVERSLAIQKVALGKVIDKRIVDAV